MQYPSFLYATESRNDADVASRDYTKRAKQTIKQEPSHENGPYRGQGTTVLPIFSNEHCQGDYRDRREQQMDKEHPKTLLSAQNAPHH
jgi:hypothetical protein